MTIMQSVSRKVWSHQARTACIASCSRRIEHFSSNRDSVTSIDLEYDLQTAGMQSSGPMVILHGLFGSKRNWLSLSKAFSKRLNRPIYSLDLRNHGSSSHMEPMTYSAMASDVLHFCRKHSLLDVSLLGHSMGGKVAMALALRPDLPPNLLSHLIIADIAPSKGKLSREFRAYIEAMQKIEKSYVKTRKEAHAILERYEKDMMTRSFLLTNLANNAPEGSPLKFRVPLDIIDRAIPELGNFPYEPGEAKWDGKTMFIKGSSSNYISDRNVPLARQFFPQMELRAVQAGHWVHAEKPDEFLDLVTRFVSS